MPGKRYRYKRVSTGALFHFVFVAFDDMSDEEPETSKMYILNDNTTDFKTGRKVRKTNLEDWLIKLVQTQNAFALDVSKMRQNMEGYIKQIFEGQKKLEDKVSNVQTGLYNLGNAFDMFTSFNVATVDEDPALPHVILYMGYLLLEKPANTDRWAIVQYIPSSQSSKYNYISSRSSDQSTVSEPFQDLLPGSSQPHAIENEPSNAYVSIVNIHSHLL